MLTVGPSLHLRDIYSSPPFESGFWHSAGHLSQPPSCDDHSPDGSSPFCSDDALPRDAPSDAQMATLAPRPGPAIIQRANSLQASDTSHTSASTADTSVSHSKTSPVSSIGESISSVVHKPAPAPVHIPPARPVRPLPVPPTPTFASTSTLKLSNQDSHSTLGKSAQGPASKTTPGATQTLTKSKTIPPRKLQRARSEAAERTPPPPPSAYGPRRISDDEPWVSISVQPVLAERLPRADVGTYSSSALLRAKHHTHVFVILLPKFAIF